MHFTTALEEYIKYTIYHVLLYKLITPITNIYFYVMAIILFRFLVANILILLIKNIQHNK